MGLNSFFMSTTGFLLGRGSRQPFSRCLGDAVRRRRLNLGDVRLIQWDQEIP